MCRYARGDGSAFEALYAALSPRLYPFCLRLTGKKSEADDVFQEAFLKLHCARASYVPGSSVVPWAFAVTRSVYLDRLRRTKRRPEDLASTDDDFEAARAAYAAPRMTGSTESEAHANELQRIIHAELAQMSERNRTAYILLRHEGLSVQEAAAVLGTTNDVVKQRAHRADEQLREAALRGGW
jgi:RNA polymerase sigma-70 factor (ECF subfamily)